MSKAAIIFAGVIVALAFLNLYGIVLALITGFLLGIDNEVVSTVEYWLCLSAGAATSFWLMRQTWPPPMDTEPTPTTAAAASTVGDKETCPWCDESVVMDQSNACPACQRPL